MMKHLWLCRYVRFAVKTLCLGEYVTGYHMTQAELADYMIQNDVRKYRIGEGENAVVVPGAEAGNVISCYEYRFFMHR